MILHFDPKSKSTLLNVTVVFVLYSLVLIPTNMEFTPQKITYGSKPFVFPHCKIKLIIKKFSHLSTGVDLLCPVTLTPFGLRHCLRTQTVLYKNLFLL